MASTISEQPVPWTQDVQAFIWVLFTNLNSARAKISRIFVFLLCEMSSSIFTCRSFFSGKIRELEAANATLQERLASTADREQALEDRALLEQVQYIHLHCKESISKIWNKYSHKRYCVTTIPSSSFLCLCYGIYIFPRLICQFCWRKYVDRSWKYINRSQTHECGNWDGEAAQFPEKEYINGIFVAVYSNKGGSWRSPVSKNCGL